MAAKVVASLLLSTHLHANALLCGKFNIIIVCLRRVVGGDIGMHFIQLGVKTRLQDFYIVYKGKNSKSLTCILSHSSIHTYTFTITIDHTH